MKKIISILIVALVALAFMGCPTTFDDRDLVIPVGDIVGDFNGDGVEAANEGSGIYSVTITYSNKMNAWNNGNGTAQFKMRTVAGNWGAPTYGCDTALTVGADFVSCSTTGGNIAVSGLVDGQNYKFIFNVTTTTVSIKVVKL